MFALILTTIYVGFADTQLCICFYLKHPHCEAISLDSLCVYIYRGAVGVQVLYCVKPLEGRDIADAAARLCSLPL